MTCPHCSTNSYRKNMSCIGCIARHVLMRHYSPKENAMEYCKQLAEKYKVDLDLLISEVKQRRSEMTPEQKKHAAKAEQLQREAARDIDKTKKGSSEAGGEKVTLANIERQKAGLIKGKLQK